MDSPIIYLKIDFVKAFLGLENLYNKWRFYVCLSGGRMSIEYPILLTGRRLFEVNSKIQAPYYGRAALALSQLYKGEEVKSHLNHLHDHVGNVWDHLNYVLCVCKLVCFVCVFYVYVCVLCVRVCFVFMCVYLFCHISTMHKQRAPQF